MVDVWDVELEFNEPGGSYDKAKFGEKTNASDGQDSKDPRFEGITEEQVKLIRYYISALTDTKCGFCGGRKRCGYMLCYTCFYILPKEFKKGLYNNLFDGLERAYDVALEYLKAEAKKENVESKVRKVDL